MSDSEPEIQHDENNGKFYVPFSDKQAVLRYSQDEETNTISFHSIFVPPSLRKDGLGEEIVRAAYEYARDNSFDTVPETVEDFFEQNTEHI